MDLHPVASLHAVQYILVLVPIAGSVCAFKKFAKVIASNKMNSFLMADFFIRRFIVDFVYQNNKDA